MCAYVNNILFNMHSVNIKVIKMDLRKVGCGVWTGSIWLRIGKNVWHL